MEEEEVEEVEVEKNVGDNNDEAINAPRLLQESPKESAALAMREFITGDSDERDKPKREAGTRGEKKREMESRISLG